jgi:transposase InsO family protein
VAQKGIQLAPQRHSQNIVTFAKMRFELTCKANGIEHRLSMPKDPETNGQFKRKDRAIKHATAKRYQHDSRGQF